MSSFVNVQIFGVDLLAPYEFGFFSRGLVA
ncbi:MAG: hypothetical protein RIR54_758, partial [Actinomycetota bacterium]